ncbi:hypothetical protein FQA39_LY17881 [Lamprigera yunnana]|nr:hypothetical protein FQA39_LY17881 [Lamprigera yunnana]
MAPFDATLDGKIIKMPDLDYTPDPRGIGYFIYERMKKFKDNIAQIHGITGEKDTYKSLLERSVRTALKMRNLGVTHEDIISLCTVNHFDSCVPYIATLFLGAKICALDPMMCLEDTVYLIKQVNPKLIFTGPEAVDLIQNTVKQVKFDTKIIVFGPQKSMKVLKNFLHHNPKKRILNRTNSGTTGLPKGICIHHYGFLCQIENYRHFGFSTERTILFASFYWVSVVFAMVAAVSDGSARIILPKFETTAIWNAIDKFKPTCMWSVPFHLMSLFQSKPNGVDTESLKHLGVVGSNLTVPHLAKIKTMFPTTEVYQGYGLTEMCVACTIFKPSSPKDRELAKAKPTSCGRGIPGVWYKVVDLETEELLGPDQPGELLLKSKIHTSGYYNLDSSHLWDFEGWFRTGDFVYYDEDLCFYVVDRLKEFFKFRSIHLLPASIENVLMQHPEISNTLVIGIPHEIELNHAMALVVLKDKNSKLTPEEIEKFVEQRVDDSKRLRAGVKIVDSIPLATTGKAKRRDIRDMVLRGEL